MVAYLPFLLFALSSILGSNGLQSSPAESTAVENVGEAAAPSCESYHRQAVAILLNSTGTGKDNSGREGCDAYVNTPEGKLCAGNDTSAVSVTCLDWQQPPVFQSRWKFTNYELFYRHIRIVSTKDRSGGRIRICKRKRVFNGHTDPEDGVFSIWRSKSSHPQFVNLNSTTKYRLAEVHFDSALQPSGDLLLFRQLIHERLDQPGEIAVFGNVIVVRQNETVEGGWPPVAQRERWLTRPLYQASVLGSPDRFSYGLVATLSAKSLLPCIGDHIFFYHYTPCTKKITVRTNICSAAEDGEKRNRNRRSEGHDCDMDLPMF